jgi:hypothetical protein
VLNPVTDIVAPVLDPVTDIVAPVLDPVTDVLSPVLDPVTDVLSPVLDPVLDIVAPVTDVVAPVLDPIPDIVAPGAPVAEIVTLGGSEVLVPRDPEAVTPGGSEVVTPGDPVTDIVAPGASISEVVARTPVDAATQSNVIGPGTRLWPAFVGAPMTGIGTPDTLSASALRAIPPTATEGSDIPTPGFPRVPVPTSPGGFFSSSAASEATTLTLLAALLAVIFMSAPGLSRWLRLVPQLGGPQSFVSLLERPG